MKLNDNYVKKTVAGVPVVLPVGSAVTELHGMIKLNGTAEVIWDCLENGLDEDAIVAELSRQFNAPADVLRTDAAAFLARLRELHILLD